MQHETISKDNFRLFILFALLFFFLHGSWLFNFSGTVDDVLLGDSDWVILARGKWAAWLFKYVFSQGPNYPYGGIFCGLVMAAAAIFQCRALGLLHLWQQVAYAVILFSSYQQIDNIGWWMQNDTCALGILCASAAASHLSQGKGNSWLWACPLVGISLGCYQSLGIYYGVLCLIVILIRYVTDYHHDEAWRLILRCLLASVVGILLYLIIGKALAHLVPEDVQAGADWYQSTMLGWGSFFEDSPAGKFWKIVTYAVSQPLIRFLTLRDGQWSYAYCLVPFAMVAIYLLTHKRIKQACAFVLGGAVVIYLPFIFAPILLHQNGFSARVMIAIPVSAAGLWGVSFLLMEQHYHRHIRALGTLLLLVALIIFYQSGMAARNRMFTFERATEELRDMYMLARIEAHQQSLHNCDILLCGLVPVQDKKRPHSLFHCSPLSYNQETAMPSLFQRWKGMPLSVPEKYAEFLHLGKRLRYASPEELERHAQKLAQMPSWPADGSVAADGEVVLIKLGDDMDPGSVPQPVL